MNIRGVMISFELPFAVYLRPEHTFAVPFRGKLYDLQFEDKRFLGPTRFGKAQNCELREDKRGTFRYSAIHLKFQTSLTTKDATELLEEGRAVANRVIAWYRHITNRAYIERVRRIDMNHAVVRVQLDGDQWQGAAIVAPPGGLGSNTATDSPQVHKNLNDALQTDEEIPAHLDLMLNAKDALRQENFRVAVIDAQSALELYVEFVLFAAYRRSGMSEMAAHKKLREGNNWKISTRVKAGLKGAIGLDLPKESTLWNKWLKAKRLRDNIVHRGYSRIEIEVDVAQTAVNTLEELIGRVQAKIDGKL